MEVIAKLEIRFIGSSILIIYEGDETRLASALERYDAKPPASTVRHPRQGSNTESNDEDDEDEDEDDEADDEGDLDSHDSSTSSDDDEDDGARADAGRARRCPPLSLRMIDFAHTRLTDGEGPDEGVLKGLETFRGLLRGRKQEVQSYLLGLRGEQVRRGDPTNYFIK